MKKKRIILLFFVLVTAFALVGCGTQERFGQRKAPRNCHTCTKWSK